LHAATIVVALLGLACLTSTRRTLSGTFDESNHLAAGLEWWQFGTYTQWTENPPLARLAIAALPYWHGMRLPERAAWEPRTHDWDRSWEVGSDLLYAGEGFERNLARARQGTLPFFLLTLTLVWLLADGRRRPLAGFVAVALTATLPSLIAHGALATTDVAFAAMFLLATLALRRWFVAPTVPRALLLGAAGGLALLTKFSVVAFLPVTALAFAGARWLARSPARPLRDDRPLPWRALAGQLALLFVAGFLTTWAGYRFSFGRIDALTPEVKGWLHLLPPVGERVGLVGALLRTPLPMPELWHGLRFLAVHDATGHDAYLLGKNSEHGFVAFYPLALLVKTPLPLLLLIGATIPLLANRRAADWPARAMALAALGILLVSLRSHVNLGIRHVFVLLPLLAVAGARAADDAVARANGGRRWLMAVGLGVLVCVQAGDAVAAREKELGFFNALAGSDPAAILLDSDLDWGQDLFLLRREVKARGVDLLKIGFFGTLRLCQHDLPRLEGLVPGRPTTGWIAISENYYRHRSTFMLLKDPCDRRSTYDSEQVAPLPFAWLRAFQPVAIVGSSVRLYHLVDGQSPDRPTP
jgi:4-amino-4-deoxy-L-arabinose transferase-like glycosyltransferase